MPRPKGTTQQQQSRQQHKLQASKNRPSEAVFSNWSIGECQRLVNHIKKHGFDGDVKKICDHFPGHTETNIRHFMNELTTRTVEEKPDWQLARKFEEFQSMARTNNLSQSYGSVQPTGVEWMALFADIPLPDKAGDVDYAEIYRSIAALMRGEIPRTPNGPTAAKYLAIIDKFFRILKYDYPDVTLPEWFKKPVVSTNKTRQQCNATLANRRSLNWSPSESAKAELLIVADLKLVRQIYLTPAWANPFRYPDEPSLFRLLKVGGRKMKNKGMYAGDSTLFVSKQDFLGEVTNNTMNSEKIKEELEMYGLVAPSFMIKQEPIYEMEPGAVMVKQAGADEPLVSQPQRVISRRRRRRN